MRSIAPSEPPSPRPRGGRDDERTVVSAPGRRPAGRSHRGRRQGGQPRRAARRRRPRPRRGGPAGRLRRRTARGATAALAGAAADLGGGPFAVRSSGIAEDGAEHSFAGMYETVLDVRRDDLPAAVDRCLASATAAASPIRRRRDGARLAVLIQRMVAAGRGRRRAHRRPGHRGPADLRGHRGPRAGRAAGVRRGPRRRVGRRRRARHRRRQPEHAIDRRQVEAVATEARRIAAARGVPQDIEWAIDADGTLWILQARPMTALPPDVSWDPPAPGAFTRQLRSANGSPSR